MNGYIDKAGTMVATEEWLAAGFEVSLTRLGTLSRHSDVWHSNLSGVPMPSEAQNVSIRKLGRKTSGSSDTSSIFAIKLEKEMPWELPWREKAYNYLAALGGLRFEGAQCAYFAFKCNPGYPEDSAEVSERPERIPSGILTGATVVKSDGFLVYGLSEDYEPITQHGESLTFINDHPLLMESLEKAGRLERRRLY